MSLKWNDDLLTGINKIDSQHKELFDLINRFFDACDRRKGREEIMRVFEFLDNYIILHFDDEEGYMVKYNYPDYIDHKRKHTGFKKECTRLKKELDSALNGSSTLNELSVELRTNWLLGQWLLTHLDEADRKLAIFLRSKGAR